MDHGSYGYTLLSIVIVRLIGKSSTNVCITYLISDTSDISRVYKFSLSRSGGRKELRGVVRLCWSESGAPHTEPPREEAGQPRDTPEPMLDQVSRSPELWLLVMVEL